MLVIADNGKGMRAHAMRILRHATVFFTLPQPL
jgi:hypothetical protein